MADFGRFRITNSGIEIEYKAQSTGTINFTKFVLGDGYYTGAIRELTNVVNPVMNATITRLNVQTSATNKKVAIGFNIDTSQITTGFYLREIGLFAEDPDTGNDVLVFYGNAGETADYISSSSSSTISEKLIDLNIYIDDVDTITATMDTSMVYVNKPEFDSFKNSTNETLVNKVDKVQGKGLSTNDYDNTEKALVATIVDKANKKITWTTTLDTVWQGTNAPYTKTITLEGMQATYIPVVDIIYSNSNATAITELEEFSKINKVVSNDGNIVLTCFEEKPEISLNIRVEVLF